MATGRGLELETRQEGQPEALQPHDTGLGFLSGQGEFPCSSGKRSWGSNLTSPGRLIPGEAGTEEGVTPEWCLPSKWRQTFSGDICNLSCSKPHDTTYCPGPVPKSVFRQVLSPLQRKSEVEGAYSVQALAQGRHEKGAGHPTAAPAALLGAVRKNRGSGYNQGLWCQPDVHCAV